MTVGKMVESDGGVGMGGSAIARTSLRIGVSDGQPTVPVWREIASPMVPVDGKAGTAAGRSV